MIAVSGVPQLVANEVVVQLSVEELLVERHGRYGIDYPEQAPRRQPCTTALGRVDYLAGHGLEAASDQRSPPRLCGWMIEFCGVRGERLTPSSVAHSSVIHVVARFMWLPRTMRHCCVMSTRPVCFAGAVAPIGVTVLTPDHGPRVGMYELLGARQVPG